MKIISINEMNFAILILKRKTSEEESYDVLKCNKIILKLCWISNWLLLNFQQNNAINVESQFFFEISRF